MNSLWGGVEQPSQRTPGGGCQHPSNGGSSEMHDWGGCAQNHGGSWIPAGGGCRKHPACIACFAAFPIFAIMVDDRPKHALA